jgi:outer membrane protein OmpA-like peptidoglycan-associated protein
MANPNYYNNDYSDYLPRYRTLNDGFLISKVEYKGEYMILSLSYVAAGADKIILYGGKHADAWKLKTGNGSRAAATYALVKAGDVRNIYVNKLLTTENLPPNGRKQIDIEKGDLLSFELYFERLPEQVRIAHLVGGEKDDAGKGRINCQDLQIKSKDNPTLGTKAQMEASLKMFYRTKEVINIPSAQNDLLAEQKEPVEAVGQPMEMPLEHSLKPINYMPKDLSTAEDMTCNERMVMSNVYFQDNKAEFSGRVKAMRTINLVVDYLRHHPDAKIVLHGHTDIFGNAFKNLELSKRRVWAVKTAITGRGIVAERIITVHHGGAQPLIKYKNGGDKNRRVEVEILCVEKEKPKDTTAVE